MKKGKEFIFSESVGKGYGIWKDYTSRDPGYMVLTGGLGLLPIILPPYDLILVLTKIVIVILAMTMVMATLTVRSANARRNVKVRNYLKTRSQYAKNRKLYFLKPQERGDMESELRKITAKQKRRSVRMELPTTED